MRQMLSIQQKPATLQFGTLLSPVLYETYQQIAHYIAEDTGCSTDLSVEYSLDAVVEGRIQIAFVCGLLFSRLQRQPNCPIEVLAAPVLRGPRYRGRPVYFSDVVVRRGSPYLAFEGLRGSVWAYNERISHSGWNIMRYSLRQRGERLSFFKQAIESGSHHRSLEMVRTGLADVTAIDSQVFDSLLLQRPQLATELRVIDALGPSPIPPIVVRKDLNEALFKRLRASLTTMHLHPTVAASLARGAIERFVPVDDEYYQDKKFSDTVQIYG